MKTLTLGELAALLGGNVVGDESVEIDGVASLRDAGPNQLSFLASAKYANQVAGCKAGGILVAAPIEGLDKNFVVISDPYTALARTLSLFAVTYEEDKAGGIHPTSFVDPTAQVDPTATIHTHAVVRAEARIGARTVIHPGVVIGRQAVIGADCLLKANVCIDDRCEVGERVVMHPGVVIGGDGFGYAVHDGAYQQVPQIGRVLIGNDVEIGANSTIDRGSVGDTTIGNGVKIDNQVQVAHNVVVGDHTVLAAHVGIAGSTSIGEWCQFGGKSGASGHVKIGDRVAVGGLSGAISDLPSNGFYSGFPAREHRKTLRAWGEVQKLAKLRKRVQELEERIEEMQADRIDATSEPTPPR